MGQKEPIHGSFFMDFSKPVGLVSCKPVNTFHDDF